MTTCSDAKHLTRADIEGLEGRYRANLINSLPGFKPAVLIGTASPHGDTNLAIFSSIFHIGANPALLGMIVRPNPPGTERHSLENLLATGVYTMNVVTEAMIEASHHSSARWPRSQSEFDATGLTALWHEGFDAPFVAESPIRIGLSLAEHHPLTINDTHFVIGRVESLDCPEAVVDAEGRIDLSAIGAQVVSGLDGYHSVDAGVRFHYAKPNEAVKRLDTDTQ